MRHEHCLREQRKLDWLVRTWGLGPVKHCVLQRSVLAAPIALPSPPDSSRGVTMSRAGSPTASFVAARSCVATMHDCHLPACNFVADVGNTMESVAYCVLVWLCLHLLRKGETYVGSMTLNKVVTRWKQIGQACETTAGHCCKTFSRSMKPNRHIDHGSTDGLDDVWFRFSVLVDDFVESIKQLHRVHQSVLRGKNHFHLRWNTFDMASYPMATGPIGNPLQINHICIEHRHTVHLR